MPVNDVIDNTNEKKSNFSSLLKYYSVSIIIAIVIIITILGVFFYFCPPDQFWDWIKPQAHKHSIDDNLAGYHAMIQFLI